jgi:hypothetical protein
VQNNIKESTLDIDCDAEMNITPEDVILLSASRVVAGPEGPSSNSHDREVVVEINGEVRRTGMTIARVGPSGLIVFDWEGGHDLTVGAISSWHVGPYINRIRSHGWSLQNLGLGQP